jgi:homoserine O-acetyltransferase
MISVIRNVASLLLNFATSGALPADYPAPTEGDYTTRDFKFDSGEMLPQLRIHYQTLRKPKKDAQGKTTNAILIMHGTFASGAQFICPEFAGELFGKDQPLDATKFFIVLPDGIGSGKSSKPSDGMHAKFPRYGYLDMVEAQYRLLTDGLGVNHARLVMGTSMGGMHTWLWGNCIPISSTRSCRWQVCQPRFPVASGIGIGSSSMQSVTIPRGTAVNTRRNRPACAVPLRWFGS